MTTTYLVVPPRTDLPDECAIVTRRHGAAYKPSLEDYHNAPDTWREVGAVTDDQVTFFFGPVAHMHAIMDSQPLAAGATFTFKD